MTASTDPVSQRPRRGNGWPALFVGVLGFVSCTQYSMVGASRTVIGGVPSSAALAAVGTENSMSLLTQFGLDFQLFTPSPLGRCGAGLSCESGTTCRGCTELIDASRACCRGTANPSRTGPACCDGLAVVHPGAGACSRPSDMSPLLDPVHAKYRGELDSENFLSVSSPGVLELLAAHVLDNGEGEGWPHGPYGNLYWDVFKGDEPVAESRDGAFRRRVQDPRVLRGPHRTHHDVDEWLDDEVLMYQNAGLFRWGTAPGTEQSLVLRVFESDFRSDDGMLGRRNDVLGMQVVHRAATESPCGTWIELHRLTNDHPRKRTDRVTVRLLVRTR